jgi:hypothetical protein
MRDCGPDAIGSWCEPDEIEKAQVHRYDPPSGYHHGRTSYAPQGDTLSRDILKSMRHDGCGGRLSCAHLVAGANGEQT